MNSPTEIAIPTRHEAAQHLARWLKTYPELDDQNTDSAVSDLVLCAAQCLMADHGADGFCKDDVMAFVEGINLLQVQAALFELVKEGAIGTTINDGEITFTTLS